MIFVVFIVIVDLHLGCRREEGPGMWVDSVLELVWRCNWVHNCSISQHDVSFQSEFSVGVLCFLHEFITICTCLFMIRAIKRSNCFHKSGGKDPCHMSSNGYMITFGIIEIIFSQIPDFDQVWWLSIVAAIMSFTYSSVGLGLGVAKVAGYTHFLTVHHIFVCTHTF